MTGLSFLVSSDDTKETIFFHEEKFSQPRTPEELLDSLSNFASITSELKGEFSNVQVIYATEIYTCVPMTLFDETKLSEYLKFNAKILANDFIAYDLVENHGIAIVYVPFVNINNYLFEQYGTFQYFHSTTLLLKSILGEEKHQEKPKVFLHLQKQSVDCVVIKDKQLQLCNTFRFRTPEDFIYYILFTFEQLRLNPDKVSCLLLGSIRENDPIHEIAYRYIRNIKFHRNDYPRIQNEAKHENTLLKTIL